MKWWLISDEDVDKIETLLNSISLIGNEEVDEITKQIRHAFGTGLHKTNCIPADFDKGYTANSGMVEDWLD